MAFQGRWFSLPAGLHFGGAIRSPAVPWLVAVPMVATMTLGLRQGAAWVAVTLLTLLALFLEEGAPWSIIRAKASIRRARSCFVIADRREGPTSSTQNEPSEPLAELGVAPGASDATANNSTDANTH